MLTVINCCCFNYCHHLFLVLCLIYSRWILLFANQKSKISISHIPLHTDSDSLHLFITAYYQTNQLNRLIYLSLIQLLLLLLLLKIPPLIKDMHSLNNHIPCPINYFPSNVSLFTRSLLLSLQYLLLPRTIHWLIKQAILAIVVSSSKYLMVEYLVRLSLLLRNSRLIKQRFKRLFQLDS